MIVVVEVAVADIAVVVDVAVVAAFCSRYNTASLLIILNPFRTAAHFWGQTTQFPSRLSPTQDSGYRGG